jgi:hypothetical protein
VSGPPTPDTPTLRAFRLLRGQVLIDLPFYPYTNAVIRAATLWPDPSTPGGWGHAFWEPAAYGRGFVPGAVDLGDVIGFTAEIHPPPALPPSTAAPGTDQPSPVRYLSWYGYLHQISDATLVLRGPYSHPLAAYTAAQQALIATLDQQHPGHEAVLPAAPPVTTSVTHTAEHTTVGDPHHGWIRVPTRLFTHALMHPTDQLRHHLTARAPGLLTGREPPITLAALTARHLPDYLSGLTPSAGWTPTRDLPTPPNPAEKPPPSPPNPTNPHPQPGEPANPTPQPAAPDDAVNMPAAAPAEPDPLHEPADSTAHTWTPPDAHTATHEGSDPHPHEPATSTPRSATSPDAPAAAPPDPTLIPDSSPGIDLP